MRVVLLGAAACGASSTPAAPPTPAAAPTPATAPAPAAAGGPTAAPSPPATPAPPPTVTIQPAPAYVELTPAGQALNCDLIIDNPAATARKLTRLEITALDASGAVTYRRFIDGNGVSPSILTVPNRDVPAQGRILMFNPLPLLPADVPVARVRFELELADASNAKVVTTAIAEVAPVIYRSRAKLRLPLRGRMIVWDGHDNLAHHRRWDYLFEPIRAFGFTSNAGRYSYDLVPVDRDPAVTMVRGDASRNESWIGFRAPVLAPAAGTVVAVSDAEPDNRAFDMNALKSDLMIVYGNRIVIDHGNGEHSLLAHLAERSAKVKVGDRVTAGQEIAAIGASGSAMFPHLHYQLQTTPTGTAEGLPSYFHGFVRRRGAKSTRVTSGQIDSGDVIEPAR